MALLPFIRARRSPARSFLPPKAARDSASKRQVAWPSQKSARLGVQCFGRLTGTADDVTAKTLLLNSTAETYNDLAREEYPTLEPVWVDSHSGDGEWDCRIRYSPVETTPSEIGSVTITGDTTGGTQHITQSLQTVGSHAPAGKTAPDFKGASASQNLLDLIGFPCSI